MFRVSDFRLESVGDVESVIAFFSAAFGLEYPVPDTIISKTPTSSFSFLRLTA